MNSIEVEAILTFAGMIVFFNAGEFEARDGGANHRLPWGGLSLAISWLVLFVAGWGWQAWLFAQIGLFFGIAAVRVLLENRERK